RATSSAERRALSCAPPHRESLWIDPSEQTVTLFVRTRGEVERVRLTGDVAAAELEGPEAVDHDHLAEVHQLSHEREVREREAVDLPVAEVAHEQLAAERAEARGCDGEAPRSVERAVRGDARDERAELVELAHEPEARPRLLVMARRVLLRVGHVDLVVQRVDAERRVAGRDRRV